jgi:hypothetical protein
MPDYELRFRLFKTCSESGRYGWHVLQNLFVRSGCRPVLEEWARALEASKVGQPADLHVLPCLEGGIGSSRSIRNVSRLQTDPAREYDEIWLRSENAADGSADWAVAELRQFGRELQQVLCNRLGELCVDFYVVVTETFDSDEDEDEDD